MAAGRIGSMRDDTSKAMCVHIGNDHDGLIFWLDPTKHGYSDCPLLFGAHLG